jgi:uncharacterized lipoprotein YajG
MKKSLFLLIALVFLAACERPYDGEKNYIEGRLVDQKTLLLIKGFKFMLGGLQVYLALAEI